MKKLGISFICGTDKKEIRFTRLHALSSIVRSLYACGALKIEEERLDSGETKVSMCIMVEDGLEMPKCEDKMGRLCFPKEISDKFDKLFPEVCL